MQNDPPLARQSLPIEQRAGEADGTLQGRRRGHAVQKALGRIPEVSPSWRAGVLTPMR